MTKHTRSVLIALFVAFLWSTSWLFIRLGLQEIPAILFAGIRYFIAFAILLVVTVWKYGWSSFSQISKIDWFYFLALGVIFYAVAQGGQYLGLALLPTMMVSLILNLTPVFVSLLSLTTLKESPTLLQWIGILLNMIGILVYFGPEALLGGKILGLAITLIALFANVGGTILGRDINRKGKTPILIVTTITMGIGALILLLLGIWQSGFVTITPRNWVYIIWMAVVNTAVAFTLWNYILKSLSAVEASIINGTMMIQIAFLAWLFLNESLSLSQILGIFFAGIGAVLVQLKSIAKNLPSL